MRTPIVLALLLAASGCHAMHVAEVRRAATPSAALVLTGAGAVSSDGATIVLGAVDGLHVVQAATSADATIDTFTRTAQEDMYPPSVQRTFLAPDAKHAVAVYSSDRFRLWDLEQRVVLAEGGGNGWTTCVAFSADGARVAVATGSSVDVLSVRTGDRLRRLERPFAHAVALSHDGSRAAAVAAGTIVVWEVATARVVREIRLPATGLLPIDGRSVAFCGERVLTQTVDPNKDGEGQRLRLHDIETGRELWDERFAIVGYAGGLCVLMGGLEAVSEDGRWGVQVTYFPRHRIYLWDLERGSEVDSIDVSEEHGDPAGVAFEPGGHAFRVVTLAGKVLRVTIED